MDRDEVEVHKKERGQYLAILTEQAWSIKNLLYGFRGFGASFFDRRCLRRRRSSFLNSLFATVRHCTQVFARQPCCIAGTMKIFCIRKKVVSHRKKNLLLLPCNMAAVHNRSSHYSYYSIHEAIGFLVLLDSLEARSGLPYLRVFV